MWDFLESIKKGIEKSGIVIYEWGSWIVKSTVASIFGNSNEGDENSKIKEKESKESENKETVKDNKSNNNNNDNDKGDKGDNGDDDVPRLNFPLDQFNIESFFDINVGIFSLHNLFFNSDFVVIFCFYFLNFITIFLLGIGIIIFRNHIYTMVFSIVKFLCGLISTYVGKALQISLIVIVLLFFFYSFIQFNRGYTWCILFYCTIYCYFCVKFTSFFWSLINIINLG
jgi:hypothetical protein